MIKNWIKERLEERTTWSGAMLIAVGVVVLIAGPFAKLAARKAKAKAKAEANGSPRVRNKKVVNKKKNELDLSNYEGVHTAKMEAKKAVVALTPTTNRTEMACVDAIEKFIPVLQEYENAFEKADVDGTGTSELQKRMVEELAAAGRLNELAVELEFARSRKKK